jgi:hypothetical protein
LHPEDLVRVAAVLGTYEGAEVDADANTVSVPAPHGVTTLGEVFRKLRNPSLDEVFLHLIQALLAQPDEQRDRPRHRRTQDDAEVRRCCHGGLL